MDATVNGPRTRATRPGSDPFRMVRFPRVIWVIRRRAFDVPEQTTAPRLVRESEIAVTWPLRSAS